MALSAERLQGQVRAAFKNEQIEEQDYEAALDRISGKIAAAVVQEIRALNVNYINGLTAPNGPVGGTLNHTIS